MNMHLCARTQVWRPRTGVFTDCFLYLLRQGLSLNPELLSLASQLANLSPLLSAGNTGSCHAHWLFIWVLGIQTLVLMLAQVLYLLRQLRRSF